MKKDFEGWHLIKTLLEYEDKDPPFFNQGEVWWCSTGMNIGREICGKSHLFTRPVLILGSVEIFMRVRAE